MSSIIYTADFRLKAIVHKTKDLMSLIKQRGGLNEAYTGLASASAVNHVVNEGAKIYAFGVDRLEVDKAIEYPPLKIYKCQNGDIILSSANLILASYVDISFIMASNQCKELIQLYANGIREITRPVELVL